MDEKVLTERKTVKEIVLAKMRQALEPEITVDESQQTLFEMVEELADQCDFKNELDELEEELA